MRALRHRVVSLVLVPLGLAAGAVACSGDPAPEAAFDDVEDAAAPPTGDPAPATADTDVPNPCPRARVAVPAGQILNVRERPTVDAPVVAKLPNHAVVTVVERVQGEAVSGNAEWLRIDAPQGTGFVSGAFASCTTDEAPVLAPPDAFYLPLACDESTRVTQGNNGPLSHRGYAVYAFDFALALNTPLVAMADGVVSHTFAGTKPGDRCYSGGGPSCKEAANYVILRHGDNTYTHYRHLNEARVTVGEFVPAGKVVGLSGGTGYSTGPHAHVVRQQECVGAMVTSCPSLPLAFADVPGDGVPVAGQTVQSKNGCPR